jgi:hypothetical protein
MWNRNGLTFARRGRGVGWQILSDRLSHTSLHFELESALRWL